MDDINEIVNVNEDRNLQQFAVVQYQLPFRYKFIENSAITTDKKIQTQKIHPTEVTASKVL